MVLAFGYVAGYVRGTVGYSFGFVDPEAAARAFFGDEPWIFVSGGDLPAPLHIRLGKSADGRLICTGLAIGTSHLDGVGLRRELTAVPVIEVRSRDLRQIRLGEILERFTANADHWAQEFGRPTLPNDRSEEAEFMSWYERTFARAPVLERPELRPGPKGHPKEWFAHVADAYRAAAAKPRPIARLAEELNASEATVRRWVQRARDLGYLGEALPGRAGEGSKKRRKRGPR